MKILFLYIRKEPRRFAETSFLVAICSVLRVIHALINTYIFNNLVALNIQGFLRYILIDIGVFLVLSVTLGLTEYVREATVQYMGLALRKDIAYKIQRTSMETFNSKDTGTYASWLTNDTTLIEQNGFNQLFLLVQIVTDPLFSLIALWHFHWSFLPVVFVMSFFTVILPQIVHKQLAKTNLSTTQSNEHLLGIINDALHGFSTFSIFGVEQQLSQRITHATRELIERKLHQVRYEAIANNVAGVSNIIGQTLVEGWTGFLAIQKMIPIGVIASSANLSYNVFNSLAVFAPILTQMQALRPVFDKYDLGEGDFHQEKLTTIPNQQKFSLEINNLTFRYPDSLKDVFRSFNLELNQGDKVALIGESGTGKSTILKIIAGQLRRYQGSIEMNSVQLRDCKLESIHEMVLYIDQTPYIFNDTIRYNLELGEKFGELAIQDALIRADLWQEICQMPNGLETSAGENGQNLSGGQRQRLALARGLLRKQKLFLFDESTSNLSKPSALRVENNILQQKELTVIFVSHQLHDENMDRFKQILKL
ncbi:ABC transporter ATP-binding protein [Pediococcus siamensis]|uniref:ABC transporter ATP-binding protein n=1 Tax=Pediococcus siamensis TaxID=381829 RepID=UPI0039A133F6